VIRVVVGDLAAQAVEGVLRPVRTDMAPVSAASRDIAVAAGEQLEERLSRLGTLPLIVVTNIVLQASPFILTLTTITMVAVTFPLTALALGFGALYPNYETENVAEIPTSFGGLLFMMAAVTYLAGVIILEAWPVYLFLNSRLQGGEAEVSTTPLVLGVSGAAVLTVVAIFAPLRAGIAKVKSVDF